MLVSQSQGVAVLTPLNDADLAQWHPSSDATWQLVAISEREFQLFHNGALLGTATRIRGSEAWQANSREGDVCIAPLHSPLDCAQRLLQHENEQMAG